LYLSSYQALEAQYRLVRGRAIKTVVPVPIRITVWYEYTYLRYQDPLELE